jgi:hypothetical protein
VPIKASSAPQIESLIADLTSDRAAVREAAVARLTVVGLRAVDRLLGVLDSHTPSSAKSAALRALEAIAAPRALSRVLDEIDAVDATVASAAVSAARGFLRGPRGAAVVDRLTQVALDRSRDDGVRIAALRALGDLERSTIAPLLETLRHDPSEAVKSATTLSATVSPVELMTRAAEQDLPDDPEELMDALTRAGASVPLTQLLRIVERVREREQAEPAARRPDWTRARGRLHATLAGRGSRIALYDLRESIESARAPLPVEFLAALSAAGDASCLEAVAAAYVRSAPSGSAGGKGDPWWRNHLADAFRTIVRRERLTRRHAVMQKLEKRWGQALEALWAGGAGKT